MCKVQNALIEMNVLEAFFRNNIYYYFDNKQIALLSVGSIVRFRILLLATFAIEKLNADG